MPSSFLVTIDSFIIQRNQKPIVGRIIKDCASKEFTSAAQHFLI